MPRAVQQLLVQRHTKAALGLQTVGPSLLTPAANMAVSKPTAAHQPVMFRGLPDPFLAFISHPSA